jgi:glycosyltransferase involved in cell wall biosynthesis
MHNNAKKRILLVIDGHEFGGGERVFLQIARELKEKFCISVAGKGGSDFESEIRGLGLEFFEVEVKKRLGITPICKLKEIIESEHVDIIHSQGARVDFFSRAAGMLSKVGRRPYIISTIAMPVEGFNVGYTRKKLYRAFDFCGERCVDRFIVVSAQLKHMLISKRGLPPSKVALVYNGVEVEDYSRCEGGQEKRKRWGFEKETPVVGAIGRLVWQKGFKYFVRAAEMISKSVPAAKFVIVGDGPLRKQIEEEIRILSLEDKFILTGFAKDIRPALSIFDVLVIPSILEGFPMVTLEAMAMGKPIVASRIDGITEQIRNGDNGILVASKKEEDLAQAVISLLQDKTLQVRIGDAGKREVLEKFSVERMVSETEAIYRSLYEGDSVNDA